MFRNILLIALNLSYFLVSAQIVSGPMLGYVEHREAAVWLEVKAPVNSAAIQYWKKENNKEKYIVNGDVKQKQAYHPITFVLEHLAMNTIYQYQFLIDGKLLPAAKVYEFKTKELWEWRKPAPDFKFLFGSCTYINDSLYDRPGKPYGQSTNILEKMADTEADFNIWGGDNLYLREADYSSASGIAYRYSHDRSTKALQRVLSLRPNYAIWDDHDYGPNDANLSFDLKHVTYDAFKQYYPQRNYGNKGNDGIYQSFLYSDAQFFMMDDRFYRSANELPDSINGKPNHEKTYYGKTQLDWLKNALISSKSVFKFIVNGSQVLNPIAEKECLRHYAAEFDELINFIRLNKIKGVVFLTGDRHFTEMHKISLPGFYDLHDFTSSPITSNAYNISKSNEFNNPTRVEGSLYMGNSYSRIGISGAKNERKVTFEIYDREGVKQWEYSIAEQQLAVPK
ncbi:MAG: alkaline phosphatase D family protein [Bacteroidia bacterium]|jgi:alkaline phosphatase D